MNVINALQTVAAIVNEHSVAFLQALNLSDLGRHQHEMPQKVFIRLLRHAKHRKSTFGDNEHMDGCLWIDVMEGKGAVVLIDDLGGDLLGDNFVEDGGLGEIGGRVGALLCRHGGA